jgi:DNA polymerase I-like protein with 3'-5' exonuclease and polymerase domains
MNKEDGTRAAFYSRFERGALVEMDFDSYHVRLIAKMIGYELPASSIHDYLGRFYFGVDELTDEQRDESKAITFRLLYGGIDREFLSIPFFAQVNDFVYKIWDKWKRTGCVETPILKRNICREGLQNMTANKLFNYYLQAVETEVSVRKLQQVQEMMVPYTSCMILYTYDSVLFDINYQEARELLPQIKAVLEQGNFPVKTKVGDIYDKIKTISL